LSSYDVVSKQLDTKSNSKSASDRKVRKRSSSRRRSVERVEQHSRKPREQIWLYGKITRGQAEDYLKNEEIGSFLIRKSDSRDGYSLSFKAENRCRHYMIDSLPNGKFIIIGEPRVHNSLKDMVEYHRKHKLSNWNGYLSNPVVIGG
jgi:hypothetical protein